MDSLRSTPDSSSCIARTPARGSSCSGFRATSSVARSRARTPRSRSSVERSTDVTFPVFQKIDVNGPGAHPLFRHLRDAQRGLLGTTAIKWNFTKFLVGRDGAVLKRYGPAETPEAVGKDAPFIAALAAAPPRPGA